MRIVAEEVRAFRSVDEVISVATVDNICSGTALKLLLYDGQGFWLLMKRLSKGRFNWWPKTPDARVPLSARELMILMWNGDPERAQMAQDWRRVA